jgi:hypothetical protein
VTDIVDEVLDTALFFSGIRRPFSVDNLQLAVAVAIAACIGSSKSEI